MLLPIPNSITYSLVDEAVTHQGISPLPKSLFSFLATATISLYKSTIKVKNCSRAENKTFLCVSLQNSCLHWCLLFLCLQVFSLSLFEPYFFFLLSLSSSFLHSDPALISSPSIPSSFGFLDTVVLRKLRKRVTHLANDVVSQVPLDPLRPATCLVLFTSAIRLIKLLTFMLTRQTPTASADCLSHRYTTLHQCKSKSRNSRGPQLVGCFRFMFWGTNWQ